MTFPDTISSGSNVRRGCLAASRFIIKYHGKAEYCKKNKPQKNNGRETEVNVYRKAVTAGSGRIVKLFHFYYFQLRYVAIIISTV